MAALRQTPRYRLKHMSWVLSASLTGMAAVDSGRSSLPLRSAWKICVFFIKDGKGRIKPALVEHLVCLSAMLLLKHTFNNLSTEKVRFD